MMTDAEKRARWRDRLIELYREGKYYHVLSGLARNVGDCGDVESMIESFCENVDPYSVLGMKEEEEDEVGLDCGGEADADRISDLSFEG